MKSEIAAMDPAVKEAIEKAAAAVRAAKKQKKAGKKDKADKVSCPGCSRGMCRECGVQLPSSQQLSWPMPCMHARHVPTGHYCNSL